MIAFDLDKTTAVLKRTPMVLRVLLEDLPEDWVLSNEGADTWSPFDVVGHLIHCERTDWIPRAEIIMDAGIHTQFPPFDRFAQFAESRGKSLLELLDEFDELRKQNVGRLRQMNLTDQDLKREGVHPEFGTVTLRQLLAAWVAHDLGHITQICRVMAHQYRDEVGPWKAYLRILGDT